MFNLLVAAIMALQPDLPRAEVEGYAALILHESKRQQIEVSVVAARVQVESHYRWNAVSRTRDHGLMQLHVSKKLRGEWLGGELLLRFPPINIQKGVEALKYWKRHHRKRCEDDHEWWLHYKYGNRVPAPEVTERSRKIMNKALRFFRRRMGVKNGKTGKDKSGRPKRSKSRRVLEVSREQPLSLRAPAAVGVQPSSAGVLEVQHQGLV